MTFFLITERDGRYKKWKMAVQRSLGWAATKITAHMTGKKIIVFLITYTKFYLFVMILGN